MSLTNGIRNWMTILKNTKKTGRPGFIPRTACFYLNWNVFCSTSLIISELIGGFELLQKPDIIFEIETQVIDAKL